jgi:hypothetical protein
MVSTCPPTLTQNNNGMACQIWTPLIVGSRLRQGTYGCKAAGTGEYGDIIEARHPGSGQSLKIVASIEDPQAISRTFSHL